MADQLPDGISIEAISEEYTAFFGASASNSDSLQAADPDRAFEAFYEKTYHEEFHSLFRPGTNRFPASFSKSSVLRRKMEANSKLYRKIYNQIAPKLHDYIREHGKPAVYPMNPTSYILFELGEEDGSLPFHEQNVGFPFHFCAPQFDFGGEPDYAFSRYVTAPEKEDTVFLKYTACKPSFRPRWSDTYDEAFTAVNSRRNDLKNRVKKLKEEIDSFDLYSGNLITGTIGGIFKFILAFLKTTLKMIAPGLALGLLSEIIRSSTVNVGAILLILFGILYLVLLVIQCVKDEVFEFLEDFAMRCKLRFAIPRDRRELPKVEQQLRELEESEAYRAGYRRNQRGYEADCRLATEWQNEWYEQFIQQSNPMLASGELAAADKK